MERLQKCSRDEPTYDIDVLIGPVEIHWQRRDAKRGTERQRPGDRTPPDQGMPLPPNDWTIERHSLDPEDKWYERMVIPSDIPDRIRINCERLVAVFVQIADSAPSQYPIVLLRPYKFIMLHERAIQHHLQDLEKKWHAGPSGAQGPETSLGVQAHDDAIVDVHARSTKIKGGIWIHSSRTFGELAQSYEALLSLRCLIQFLDTRVLPIYRSCRSATPGKVRFHDLWYLYRPGDLVVSWKDQHGGEQSAPGVLKQDGFYFDHTSAKTSIAVWKVLKVSKGRPVLDDCEEAKDRGPWTPTKRINKLLVLCYMIGYNGLSFGPVSHTFEVSPFDGPIEVTTIDPFPTRCIANYPDLETQLMNRGKKFIRYCIPAHVHCSYVGMTLPCHPSGIECRPAQKATLVDGYVIVDLMEACRDDPEWIFRHEVHHISDSSGGEYEKKPRRRTWYDKRRYEGRHEIKDDHMYEDDHLDVTDMENFIMSDTFLCATKEAIDQHGSKIDGTDLMLLPDRVVGFDLHRKKFSMLALDCLHSVQVKEEGWANLKLPRGHKRMVQAQVRTHFLEKQLSQRGSQHNVDHDIVRGKGQGLISLLHGAPGVGKTSTAECVAESLRKPLYPITCGDLGVTASVVEENFSSIFAKAETWDCVLLLDEADVFLAQRTRIDLKRNAIVSGKDYRPRSGQSFKTDTSSLPARPRVLPGCPDTHNESGWRV